MERSQPLLEPLDQRQPFLVGSPTVGGMAILDLLLQPGVGLLGLLYRRSRVLLASGRSCRTCRLARLHLGIPLGHRLGLPLLEAAVELVGVLVQGQPGIGQGAPQREVGIPDTGGGLGSERPDHDEDGGQRNGQTPPTRSPRTTASRAISTSEVPRQANGQRADQTVAAR